MRISFPLLILHDYDIGKVILKRLVNMQRDADTSDDKNQTSYGFFNKIYNKTNLRNFFTPGLSISCKTQIK